MMSCGEGEEGGKDNTQVVGEMGGNVHEISA